MFRKEFVSDSREQLHSYFLQNLEQFTKTGCWEYKIKENELLWSDETYWIHKIPKEEKIDVESAINFYHPEDREVISEHFKQCLEEEKPFQAKLRIIDREGRVVHVHAAGKPIYNEKGEVHSIFGTFKDLSDEVEMLDQINEKSHELGSIKETISEFLIYAETDTKGKITKVNQRFCEISGYESHELIGQDHRMINSGHHPKSFFEGLWKNVSEGRPWEGLVCNRKKDGEEYWVQSFIFPKRDKEEKICGYVAYRFDVTDRILLEKELEEEKENATFSSQLAAVGEMSASIAHEIANPLSIISGRINGLTRYQDNPERLQKIQHSIEQAANRISKIIQGLKKLSHHNKNQEFEVKNIKDVVHETFDFCGEILKKHGIQLIYDDLADFEIVCQEVKISQILLNLITNARDAILSYEDRMESWIRVEVHDLGLDMAIHVIDSGPGVSSEIKEKIMKSFFTTKKTGKGTGLGLALVNRFAKEHHGEVFLNESFDHTCFTVMIPKDPLSMQKKSA